MLGAWWRRWTGLAELEQRIDAMVAEVQASRREVARERSRIPQYEALVAEKDAEIQRLIREVGHFEHRLTVALREAAAEAR